MKSINILVVGDMGCGKSTLITNFIDTAADLTNHTVDWQHLQKWTKRHGSVSIRITEVSHGESEHSMAIFKSCNLAEQLPKAVNGILYVFDIGGRKSFKNIFRRHKPFIKKLIRKKIPSLLVATHGNEDIQVESWVQQQAEAHKLPLFVADGKTGLGCSQPFQCLLKIFQHSYKPKQIKPYEPTYEHYQQLKQLNSYGNSDMLPDDRTIFSYGSPYSAWFAQTPISTYIK